jgi:hypothetical protein
MNREHIASLARDVQAHADIIAEFASKHGVPDEMLRREVHGRIALIGARLQWMLDQVGPEEPVDPLAEIVGQLDTKLPPGVHTLGARNRKPPEDAA